MFLRGAGTSITPGIQPCAPAGPPSAFKTVPDNFCRTRRVRIPQFGMCGIKLRTSEYLKDGAGTKIRTRDLLITNQLLYQLSYTGTEEIISLKRG
jgi:hypothetical protein